MSQKTQCHCRWNPGTLHQLGFLSCWEGQLSTRPCFLWSRSHWGTLLENFGFLHVLGLIKWMVSRYWSSVVSFFSSFGKSGQGWVGVGGYSRDSCMKPYFTVCTSALTSSASSGLLFGACAFLLRALEREREREKGREREKEKERERYYSLVPQECRVLRTLLAL